MTSLSFILDDSTQSTTTTINGTSTSISVYALTTNLNSLSSYSYLNISGTNANLNGLSSYSYLNISGVGTS